MKSVPIAAAAAIGFAGAALAEGPQLLTDDQMDKIVAGNTPPGVIDVATKGGATLLYVYLGSYPPPPVKVDGTPVNQSTD